MLTETPTHRSNYASFLQQPCTGKQQPVHLTSLSHQCRGNQHWPQCSAVILAVQRVCSILQQAPACFPRCVTHPLSTRLPKLNSHDLKHTHTHTHTHAHTHIHARTDTHTHTHTPPHTCFRLHYTKPRRLGLHVIVGWCRIQNNGDYRDDIGQWVERPTETPSTIQTRWSRTFRSFSGAVRDLTFSVDSLTVVVQPPIAVRPQLHASMLAYAKNPKHCNHTIVWIHENTVYIDRNGLVLL